MKKQRDFMAHASRHVSPARIWLLRLLIIIVLVFSGIVFSSCTREIIDALRILM